MAPTYQRRGPWGRADVDAFLCDARIPLRLAAVASSGFPIVASLWFVWEDDTFLCATGASTPLAKALRGNDRCGFEIAVNDPPYRGVRGQAIASLVEDGDRAHLRLLLQRYLGDDSGDLARWLLTRPGTELTVVLRPQRLMSWDYSARMGAADGQG